jgi:hypothetical protein
MTAASQQLSAYLADKLGVREGLMRTGLICRDPKDNFCGQKGDSNQTPQSHCMAGKGDKITGLFKNSFSDWPPPPPKVHIFLSPPSPEGKEKKKKTSYTVVCTMLSASSSLCCLKQHSGTGFTK